MRIAFFQRIFAHYQAGLVRELSRNSEHDFFFFGDVKDPMGSGIEPIDLALRNQVSFITCRTFHLNKYLALQFRAILETIYGEFDAYIFEGSFTILTNWVAILVARLRGKRVLLYSHGWLKRENGIKGWLRRSFYRLANGLLLYGNRSKRIGIELGFSPDRLYVAYNSLDLKVIDKCRKVVSQPICNKLRTCLFGDYSHNPLILCVGRLVTLKKLPLLIDAAACLKVDGIDVNLILIGDGPDRAMIINKANDLNVNLVLVGACYDEAFLSICFSSADITVVPGAAGLTVVHSLSYGTPVIVHNDLDRQGPEAEAIKDSINGALFQFGDTNSLASSIQTVLKRFPLSEKTQFECRSTIDDAYTPIKMRLVFDDALNGNNPQ